jgi:hypothetical protein
MRSPKKNERKGNKATPANSQRNKSVQPALESPWKLKIGSLAADKNLELILTTNAHIPLKFWRKNFWFAGARDESLHALTGGEFSRDIVAGKAHPVLALNTLEHGVGCSVCPCSSKKPRDAASFRFIREGCTLRHTGHVMDRNSYMVDGLAFSIPSSLAYELYFKGEVPQLCVDTVEKD